MKVRKRVFVLDAVQVTRRNFENVTSFVPKEVIDQFNNGEFAEDSCYLMIKTKEGIMEASEGDWVIRGIEGEFYPCKPHIFEKLYEKVED